MKLTNRGRKIKDNSRRTGAGAQRKQDRRDRAAASFSVLSFDHYCAESARPRTDQALEDYNGYVARKNVEKLALGL